MKNSPLFLFTKMNINGYILVGGKSSRMQTDKANLKLKDKTFAEIARDSMKSVSDKISFLVGENKKTLEFDAPQVIDIYQNKGALGGIHAGLSESQNNIDATWICVLACDYPFVSGKLLQRLASLINEKLDAVVPIQPDERTQPLCAFYKIEKCLEIAERMLSGNDESHAPSMRDFLDNLNVRFVEFAEIADLPNSENFFFNVNTPEDFDYANEINLIPIVTAEP
ncbi:MAG: molybdenum cofactor guanylyltransferase [Pyrinomonadaceae bacterium]|nr:molybdenum cofactor guanylyltransferase [Pyrinomonadaceae bacterium]